MSLVTTLVPLLVLRNYKLFRATPYSFFCSWIRFAADFSIGGGRAALLGADASSVLVSVTGASVSIWVVRSVAKKFLVGICT
jgi:hypothetical protein